ncbi:hypothetical protein HYFRA_00007758 [Hymenoscyphus fraxineus]|uniref:Uncharacterized protein n=1 Tax=Hymenoscyphus fraxineus TaxID=746836 RepID=A0A9N9KM36_9HELO|nr:hypothetical protein HYFRA_00007758 [Hymenoscyphus fraxineus]
MYSPRQLTLVFLISVGLIWALYEFQKALLSVQDLHEAKSKLTGLFSNPRLHSDHSEEVVTSNDLTILCDQTQWTQGLWLQCTQDGQINATAIAGGLNNAGNRLQTCIRLAIDAGAGLIFPHIKLHRNTENQRIFTEDAECLDNYWDMGYLSKELGRQCPQLQLRHCGDISGIETIIPTPQRDHLEEPYYTNSFGEMITSQLRSSDVESIDPQQPVAVSFGDAYVAWNYSKSNELSTIQKSLFRLLKFNPILVEFSNILSQSPELKDGYIAVHLRGEDDWPAKWGSPKQQSSLYLSEMRALQHTLPTPLKTVYVSCGSQDAISAFASQLTSLGYTVYNKDTLLSRSPGLLNKLHHMHFDQKAIVETEVLVAADYWYGVFASTFSDMVAYKRTINDEGNIFKDHIIPGSNKTEIGGREWDVAPALLGVERTKLLVTNTGPLDITDRFP